MDHSLNNEEVAKIAGREITMIPYTDIHLYENLDDLFATDCVLLNYLSTKNYGHWVGLHRKKNKISFFDSYGRMPDSQLEFIPFKYRIESNQDYPYLVKLMKKWVDTDPKRSVHYNSEQLQKYSSRITKCGRWVGYYFHFSDTTTIEKFESNFIEVRDKFFRDFKPKNIERELFFDKLIVKLTDELLYK